MLTISAVGCADDSSDAPEHPLLPDYSDGEQFEFFAYRTLYDGYYYIDGEPFYTGQDYRSVEKYAEYKDCGFTIVYIHDVYRGEEWATSPVKMSMEKAYEAGNTKLIVTDQALNGCIESGLDSLNERFPTDAELDAFIKKKMDVYSGMPGFYGVELIDEPYYHTAGAYGRTYKSIKRVAKEHYGMDDIYIHMNFLPLGAASNMYDDQTEDWREAYTSYLEGFMSETGTNRISADTYAFHGWTLAYGFYPSVQILSELCKKYGSDMSYCLQSCHSMSGTSDMFRRVDKSEMRLEMSSLIGFGATNFAYYTYMPDQSSSSTLTGGKIVDDGSFLTREGEKNNIWYYGKELMAEAQKLAPVITHFDYQGAKMVENTTAGAAINLNNAPYLESLPYGDYKTPIKFDNSYEFKKLKSISQNNDIALVTELKDSENDLYMYMVQNVIDPGETVDSEHGKFDMDIELNFGSCEWVAEFNCGELRYVKLNNGVYRNKLSAGYAVYLIPLYS